MSESEVARTSSTGTKGSVLEKHSRACRRHDNLLITRDGNDTMGARCLKSSDWKFQEDLGTNQAIAELARLEAAIQKILTNRIDGIFYCNDGLLPSL